MLAVIKTGQPDGTRFGPVGPRLKNLAVESLGHTRMLKWSTIGAAHWFVMVGFYGLFLTLVEAFGEVFSPRSTCRSSATGASGTCSSTSSAWAPCSASWC